MNNYDFFADILAKYSVSEPWIQAIILISFTTITVSLLYFIKEMIVQTVSSIAKFYMGYRVANNVARAASKIQGSK